MSRAKRKDPRGHATRTALIEAAEELFASQGISNVTLRQIGKAIGSEHNGVVFYYFGSKNKLLEAICDYRLPQIENRRAQLLERADECGLGHDMLVLFYISWLPILEQKGAKGNPSYAAFLSSLSRSEPTWRSWLIPKVYPARNEIQRRINDLMPAMPEELFWARQKLGAIIMIEAIQDITRLNTEASGPDLAKTMFTDALGMVVAAYLTSPGSPDSLLDLETQLDIDCLVPQRPS